MAEDKKTIAIELKNTGSNGEPDTSAVNNGGLTNDEKTKGRNALITLSVQTSVQAAQTIQSLVVYEMNRSLTLTENYKAQVQLSNAMTAVNKAMSLGISMASSAVMGFQAGAFLTAGNPIGAGVGAAIGATAATINWAAQEAVNIYQRFDQASLELAAGNLQASYGMSRLGLTDGGRGTQN